MTLDQARRRFQELLLDATSAPKLGIPELRLALLLLEKRVRALEEQAVVNEVFDD